METKKIDGIKKIRKENIQESRKIVLESIEDEIAKEKGRMIQENKLSKKVDGIFSVLKKKKEKEKEKNKDKKKLSKSMGDITKVTKLKEIKKQENVDIKSTENNKPPHKLEKEETPKIKDIEIDAQKRTAWKKEIEDVLADNKDLNKKTTKLIQKTEQSKKKRGILATFNKIFSHKTSNENKKKAQLKEQKKIDAIKKKEEAKLAKEKEILKENLAKEKIKKEAEAQKLKGLEEKKQAEAKRLEQQKLEDEKKKQEEEKRQELERIETQKRQKEEQARKEIEKAKTEEAEKEAKQKRLEELKKKEQERVDTIKEKLRLKEEKKKKRQEAKEAAKKEKEKIKEERIKQKEEELKRKEEERIAEEKKKKEETQEAKKIKLKKLEQKKAEKEKKLQFLKEKKKEKKEKREETLKNINSLVKDLSRTGKEKVIYIAGKAIGLSLTFLLICIFCYTLIAVIILKLDIDNKATRYIAKYIFVPAFISTDGAVEYFNYQDYINFSNEIVNDAEQADINAKLVFTKEFIFHKLLKEYQLPNINYRDLDDDLKGEINKKLLMDVEINQVPLSRMKKLKELIEDNNNFVKIASKYGDKTGSIIINDENKDKFSYYENVQKLDKGDISNIFFTSDGYYIFRVFDKNKKYIELNYVHIFGKNLDNYLEEEIDGYKLWSFID